MPLGRKNIVGPYIYNPGLPMSLYNQVFCGNGSSDSSCLTFIPLSSQQHVSMVSPDSINSIPNWLLILTQEEFFTRCLIHDSVRKNQKKNILCLDCCTSICPHCLPLHQTHVLLQIRRYMYNDVIRLGDAQRLLNCSLVQPYITNRAKVVYLKRRPQSRCLRGTGNLCIICDRSLQEPYIFCSLSCKVHHLVLITRSATIRDSWNKHEFSVVLDRERRSENPQEFEDSQVTPDSVLDSLTSTSLCTLSGSTSTTSSWGGDNEKSLANSELLKRKSSSVQLVPRIWCTPATELATAMTRRKGVPHRSPLY